MKLVDHWLRGIGLEYAIPRFHEQGITTPQKLAQLTLRDMYELVGDGDTQDRKNLYYLVERIRQTLEKDTSRPEGDTDPEDGPSGSAEPAPSPAARRSRSQHTSRLRQPAVHSPTYTDDEDTLTPSAAGEPSSSKLKRPQSMKSPSKLQQPSQGLPHRQARPSDEDDMDGDSSSRSGTPSRRLIRPKSMAAPKMRSARDHSDMEGSEYEGAVDEGLRSARKQRVATTGAASRSGSAIRESSRSTAQTTERFDSPQSRRPRSQMRSRREEELDERRAIASPRYGSPTSPRYGSPNPSRARSPLDAPRATPQAHASQSQLHRSRNAASALDISGRDTSMEVRESRPSTRPAAREDPRHRTQSTRLPRPQSSGKLLTRKPSTRTMEHVSEYGDDLSSPPPPPPPARGRAQPGRYAAEEYEDDEEEEEVVVVRHTSRARTTSGGAEHSRANNRRLYAEEFSHDDDFDDSEEVMVYESSKTRYRNVPLSAVGHSHDVDERPTPKRAPPPSSKSSSSRSQQQQVVQPAQPPQQQQSTRPKTAENRNAPAEAVQQSQQQQSQQQQSRALPPIVDMPIRVVVRKRPLSKKEVSRGETDVMEIVAPDVHVHEQRIKVDLTKCIETHTFTFDDSFDEHSSNEDIYRRTIQHLIRTVFEGCKATCFAYGQTGSGKTFTMLGADPTNPAATGRNAGLYVLASRDLFTILNRPENDHLAAYASCFEIYGGKLFDLFHERKLVRCLEDHKQQVQILGLTEHRITDVGSLLQLMENGATNRSTGTTGANADSSRSHAILQLVIRDTRKPKNNLIGKFSFIDLAGSERGADTTKSDKQTRLEGAEINTSLLALKEVIRALDKKNGHTPFRGSKLTQVLKDSFIGKKTRTVMIGCISPNRINCEHSLNTLRYADRVKEHHPGKSAPGDAVIIEPGLDPEMSTYDESRSASNRSALEDRQRASSAQAQTSPAMKLFKKMSSDAGAGESSHSGRSGPGQSRDDEPLVEGPTGTVKARRVSYGSPAMVKAVQGAVPTRRRSYHSEDYLSEPDNILDDEGYPEALDEDEFSMDDEEEDDDADSVGSAQRETDFDDAEFEHEQAEADNEYARLPLADRALQLVAAHKIAISEMVEVTKEEIDLIHDMEDSDTRHRSEYLRRLERMLDTKVQAIETLQLELQRYQRVRNQEL